MTMPTRLHSELDLGFAHSISNVNVLALKSQNGQLQLVSPPISTNAIAFSSYIYTGWYKSIDNPRILDCSGAYHHLACSRQQATVFPDIFSHLIVYAPRTSGMDPRIFAIFVGFRRNIWKNKTFDKREELPSSAADTAKVW